MELLDDVVHQIERRVLEQGSLTKADILAGWQLKETTYPETPI